MRIFFAVLSMLSLLSFICEAKSQETDVQNDVASDKLYSETPARRFNLKNLGEPIELDAGPSSRMYVIFNHSDHTSVKCRTCHHEGLPGNRYAPCTNSQCHAITAPSSRDPLSVYMAYHAPGMERSCLGCHKSLASKYPNFNGCRPCHETPQGRKMRSEAAASSLLETAQ